MRNEPKSPAEPNRASESRKLPPLVEQLRDRAIARLTGLLAGMLDNADDALFDLADKAHSNSDQSMFFDSMRELRIKRKGMEMTFRQELQNAFRGLSEPVKVAPADVLAIPLEHFALVKEAELEESLAVEGMVKKARVRNDSECRQLFLRLLSLMPGELQDRPNPFDPEVVVEAFRAAHHKLELTIKAGLIVYKLFDRYVVSRIDGVYRDLNAWLADLGVLADARFTPPPRSAAASTASAIDDGLGETVMLRTHTGSYAPTAAALGLGYGAAGAAPASDSDMREMFGMLRELLSQQKGQQPSPASAESRAQAYRAEPAALTYPAAGGIPVGTIAATQDVLRALSLLQSQALHQPPSETPAKIVNLRSAIVGELPRVSAGARQVASMDEDVIDIVSMLFDFILDDRNLQDDIKTLLLRLQIPMLKVGLIDKAFFSKRQHPARRLLNEMAQAALGWDPVRRAGKDGLYGKIEALIERVIAEFDSDLRVFEEVLREFEAYVEEENRRVALIEKRTKEVEEGRARSDNARAQVHTILQPLLLNKRSSEAVRDLLADTWSHVMFLVALREGTESPAWQASVACARDLVASTLPLDDEAVRHSRLMRLPGLLVELKAGLDSIAYSQVEQAKFFEALENAHRVTLQAPLVQQPQDLPSTEMLLAGFPDEASLKLAQTLAPTEDDVDLSGLEIEALEPEFAAALPESEPATTPAAQESDEERQRRAELLIRIDALPLGAWIELLEIAGEQQANRCKLVARLPSTGKLIFVNRNGIKIADFKRDSLAGAMLAGRVRMLDDAALFDRALEAVIANLRKQKTDE